MGREGGEREGPKVVIKLLNKLHATASNVSNENGDHPLIYSLKLYQIGRKFYA